MVLETLQNTLIFHCMWKTKSFLWRKKALRMNKKVVKIRYFLFNCQFKEVNRCFNIQDRECFVQVLSNFEGVTQIKFLDCKCFDIAWNSVKLYSKETYIYIHTTGVYLYVCTKEHFFFLNNNTFSSYM